MKSKDERQLNKQKRLLIKEERPYQRAIEHVKQEMSLSPEELQTYRQKTGYARFHPVLERLIREGVELGYTGGRLDRHIKRGMMEMSQRRQEANKQWKGEQRKVIEKLNEHPLNQQAKKLLITAEKWAPFDQLHVLSLMWAYPLGIDAETSEFDEYSPIVSLILDMEYYWRQQEMMAVLMLSSEPPHELVLDATDLEVVDTLKGGAWLLIDALQSYLEYKESNWDAISKEELARKWLLTERNSPLNLTYTQ